MDKMTFPCNWEGFLGDYSFVDHREFYTNGARLIPTFRVEQLIEHYFAPDNNVSSKWIPVSERLPEPFEVVYVYASAEQYVTDAYMTRHKEWCGVRMKDEVTHWMPLPEPPKEKG